MRLATVWIALALLPALAHGQQTIDELFGANAGDQFGASVAFVGDLNHDGSADFAVGAPGDDTAATQAGSVTVFSGFDRSVLFHWDGLAMDGELGASVGGVGDVDLDGCDDVIAGAPGASQVLVFSGCTGGILYDITALPGTEFGRAVAGVGFADGDAWPDFAVGAAGATGLRVFSGRTGGLHWSSPRETRELAGLGDVDGDGRGDLIAGDYRYDSGAGRATVFSGFSGSIVREHVGNNTFQDQLGKGVSGFGDVDGDTFGDYGYGVPCICFASHYGRVHSGATGAEIHYLSQYTFGWDMAPGGDLDLDGVPDVLVTEPGSIFAYSGSTGDLLSTFGDAEVVDGGSDADGDGLVDVLGGAGHDDTAGADAGRVSLYTLGCPSPVPVNYCAAASNTTGQPAEMGWQGSVSIADDNFRLVAQHCPSNQFGVFFYGAEEAYLPVGDGFLCVSSPIFRFDVVNTGPAGVPSWIVDFANPPMAAGLISAGEAWRFSFWFRDPTGGPAGNNLSDGLRVAFCP